MRGHWQSQTRKLNSHWQSVKKKRGGLLVMVDNPEEADFLKVTFLKAYTYNIKITGANTFTANRSTGSPLELQKAEDYTRTQNIPAGAFFLLRKDTAKPGGVSFSCRLWPTAWVGGVNFFLNYDGNLKIFVKVWRFSFPSGTIKITNGEGLTTGPGAGVFSVKFYKIQREDE